MEVIFTFPIDELSEAIAHELVNEFLAQGQVGNFSCIGVG